MFNFLKKKLSPNGNTVKSTNKALIYSMSYFLLIFLLVYPNNRRDWADITAQGRLKPALKHDSGVSV